MSQAQRERERINRFQFGEALRTHARFEQRFEILGQHGSALAFLKVVVLRTES
ncbi:hypothetical protein [Blastopirellula marina]|uniref:hypothetical protein n=1 Tax=Blastopirellula marina TaxID=124 RepID=UPI0013049908|nr:hypothetical protein [Blastopirellula marina]